MTIPHRTTTSTSMLNNTTEEKSTPRFSYLIRPTTPCIFGTEYYDDRKPNDDDDEFFVTAGGILHSCPNIYELSIDNEHVYRKCQSCDYFMFIQRQTTSVHHHLNTYDTELNRYSILPRFQPVLSSPLPLSNDSISSEIELYKERHAKGLPRKCTNSKMLTSSSFLSKTWKSDGFLLPIPILHNQFSLSFSGDNHKRTYPYDLRIRQTFASIYF